MCMPFSLCPSKVPYVETLSSLANPLAADWVIFSDSAFNAKARERSVQRPCFHTQTWPIRWQRVLEVDGWWMPWHVRCRPGRGQEGVRELQASQGDLKGDVLSELRWIMLGLKVEGCPSCLDWITFLEQCRSCILSTLLYWKCVLL